jgi:cytochrome c553
MKIALSIVALLLLVGCSEQKEAEQSTEVITPVPESAPEMVREATKTATQEVSIAKEVVVEEPKANLIPSKGDVTPTPTPIEPMVSEELLVQKDGATLFRACASCHGADASKAALGKSQVIKGWSAQKIADALHGYKNKTYGGASKAMMQGQVAKLSDEDIKILAEYITKL